MTDCEADAGQGMTRSSVARTLGLADRSSTILPPTWTISETGRLFVHEPRMAHRFPVSTYRKAADTLRIARRWSERI